MPASVRSAHVSDADAIARLTRQLGYESEPAIVEARLTTLLSGLGYRNIKTQYTFAKSLDPDRPGEVQNLVPKLDEGSTLVGTWRLTSCEARTSMGDVRYPFGELVSGQLMYDAAFNMSPHVMRATRQAFATADAARGTDAEVRAAFESHTSYFGTYTVDPTRHTVTHHVKGASFPNWVGHDQVRYYRFDRGRLLLSTPPLEFGGQSLEYVLIWERVKR